MGKTRLLEAAVARAASLGILVLAHRATRSDASLALGGLTDLLASVVALVLHDLPAPRRRALAAALVLDEAELPAPDPRVLRLAVMDVLTSLEHRGPVLVAIDDLQWMDPTSLALLDAVARRLVGHRIGWLTTERSAGALDEHGEADPHAKRSAWFAADGIERLSLAPLSAEAVASLIRDNAADRVAPPLLRRLRALSAGNPYFAIELARHAWGEDGAAAVDMLPAGLVALVEARVVGLGPDICRGLALVAALGEPTWSELRVAFGGRNPVSELAPGLRARVIRDEGLRPRFTHPMLAAAVIDTLDEVERRQVLQAAAAAAHSPELRATLLAAAAEGPDETVASALESAAHAAAVRGAPDAAGDRFELAAEHTLETDTVARRRRLGEAAAYHRIAGDNTRAALLLDRALYEEPPGRERAALLISRARIRRDDLSAALALLDQARVQPGLDNALSADIEALAAWLHQIGRDIPSALRAARAALVFAERTESPERIAGAIARVSMAETWAMDRTSGLLERGLSIEAELPGPLEYHASPRMTAARRDALAGRFDEARQAYETALVAASERGDEGTRGRVLFHLSLLEWYSGRVLPALARLAEATDLADQLDDPQFRGTILHVRSFVAAHFGEFDEARELAEQGRRLARAADDALFLLAHGGVLGFIELSLGHAAAADARLRPLLEAELGRGWEEPAFNPLWSNALDAAISAGALDAADELLRDLERRAVSSVSVWTAMVAARNRAALAAATGNPGTALAAANRAVDLAARLGSPFETARTHLVVGVVERRLRRRSAARASFVAAAETFDRLGSRPWAARSRRELAGLGLGRATGTLTDAEARVADLVATGLSNKEVAAAVGAGEHTIEVHLSRVYRKLGLRGRNDLARALFDRASRSSGTD